jgi:hypothetical protein
LLRAELPPRLSLTCGIHANSLQTLLYLLRRSYAYIYQLLTASEPVSEALLPIYNQLQTLRKCLLEVRRSGGVNSPRELYPYSMKVSSFSQGFFTYVLPLPSPVPSRFSSSHAPLHYYCYLSALLTHPQSSTPSTTCASTASSWSAPTFPRGRAASTTCSLSALRWRTSCGCRRRGIVMSDRSASDERSGGASRLGVLVRGGV